MTKTPYLKALFQSPDLFMAVLNPEGKLIDANEAALDFINYDLKDVKGDKFWETPWWDHSEGLQAKLKEGIEAANRGEKTRFEADHFSPEGDRVTVDFVLRPVEVEDSSIRLLALGRDITERKVAEKELKAANKKCKQSRERYRKYFEELGDAIFILAMGGEDHGRILDVNPTAAEQTGYSRKELIGLNMIEDLSSGQPQGMDYEEANEKLSRGETVSFTEKKERKDGSKYWTEVVVTPIDYEGREANLSINRDISERRELQRKQKLVSFSLDQASVEIYWIKPDGKFVYTNEKVKESLGYSEKELADMYVWDIDPNPEHAKNKREERWEKLKEEEVLTFESDHLTKNGETFPVEISSNYVKYGDSEYEFAFAKDITERKESRRQLQQSEEELRQSFIELAETTSRVLGVRDPYTREHEQRVAELAEEVGKRMGLDEDKLLGLYLGGVLHDIGKIAIPETILTKPGELKDVEWQMIKSHPKVGYNQILEDTDFPWPVSEMALHHHERLDGSGYPHGLEGDELSLEVRILGAVDVVEAMSTRRPYRAARSKEQTLDVLEEGRGDKFDPEVVDVLVDLIDEGIIEFG